jgi:hypothetical protein
MKRMLLVFLLCLGSACGNKPVAPVEEVKPVPEKVTFYPTYGYLENGVWRIPLRAWVHEERALLAALAELPGQLGVSEPRELQNFQHRIRDFVADSESRERVTLRFAQDTEDYAIQDAAGALQKTSLNGLVEGVLALSAAKAEDLLRRQNAQDGWLTLRASSQGHSGFGRVQLIPPTGLSIVSDIDDTVKETGVPAGAEVVVRNTFFRDFVAAPEMAQMYQKLSRPFDRAVFHYVSGGPFQLYTPLADFLLSQPVGFPAGTFHLKVIPKHLFSTHTWDALARLVLNPDATFDHKVTEISTLMQRFPQRKFILIGDSGEQDPEIYQHLKSKFGAQVQEIRIRDVVNARTQTPARLAAMTIIPAATVTK